MTLTTYNVFEAAFYICECSSSLIKVHPNYKHSFYILDCEISYTKRILSQFNKGLFKIKLDRFYHVAGNLQTKSTGKGGVHA